jgi:hypothetical protein
VADHLGGRLAKLLFPLAVDVGKAPVTVEPLEDAEQLVGA